jgi:WD40 repeat protein
MRRALILLLFGGLALAREGPADPDGPAVRKLLGHRKAVECVAFSPDGRTVATVSMDRKIRFFDVEDATETRKLSVAGKPAAFAVFSSEGDVLFAGREGGVVRRYRTTRSGRLTSLRGQRGNLTCGARTEDGKLLVTADDEGGVCVWDLVAGELRRTIEGEGAEAAHLAVSADGSVAACGDVSGRIRIFDLETGVVARGIEDGEPVTALALTRDARTLLIGGTALGEIRVVDVSTGEAKGMIYRHGSPVVALALSRDGSLLASGDRRGVVVVWRHESRAPLRILEGHEGAVASMEFSPDGRFLATGGTDSTVCLWDWRRHVGPLRSVAESVDLRPELKRLGLRPRRQGQRGTCSVFVTAGTFEFALSRVLGRSAPVSVEYLNWAANQAVNHQHDGQFFHNVEKGIANFGFCEESLMPYQPTFNPSLRPSKEARRNAEENLVLGFEYRWINVWKPKADVNVHHLAEVRAVLAAGWPVGAGSPHSVLLVGYADDPEKDGGGSLLTRDSAKGAYAELTYGRFVERFGDLFWVEPPGEKPRDE